MSPITEEAVKRIRAMNEIGAAPHTLRDYFAANVDDASIPGIGVKADREALAGRPEPDAFLKGSRGLDSILYNFEVEAALRYIYADAMLAARNRT